ncbi:glycoside hydrolase [Paenibacillus helianthi]|uniref:Glycoside hydrolase n=1 Tax=Paenibacillus helianthi TaxID=1349432 RepID=A0ABX3EHG4_9BACL|nr:cellulase family glycosylhydrolase [Paenibacillus helianthi]OKP82720.1 glycoside hydrolase [Paenibacillus helianthi]
MNIVNGFIKAKGPRIVNGHGEELLLRGVGFGNWLLPEGYMWRFPGQGDRPRRIEQMIRDLIGEEKARDFWKAYYDRYITEADIQRIAAEGFNSVRIPMNSRFLYDGDTERYDEDHLVLLDRVIGWCEAHRVYAILDLHGAPGGQTGTNIDDSPNDKPELFIDADNRRRTIEIWRMLAGRYKDKWIVAGYDLLNEPLPEWFSAYNSLLMPLYNDIIRAIREVDDKHMIILEGVHWATDWSIFEEKPDDNLMLQFHKYWNSPDTESIQKFLDKRTEWDVPIYMGEGGENNIEWYTGAFRLYEDHDISWNFWTWKKLDTTNSPCSVRMPEGWETLIGYLEGGAKPETADAEQILGEYLANLSLDRCVYLPEIVHSLLFRPPVRIPAIFYGYKGQGISYHVEAFVERELGFRDSDGTDIRFTSGNRKLTNFQHMRGEDWAEDEWMHVYVRPHEWLAYEVNHTSHHGEGHLVSLRVCGMGDEQSKVEISINDGISVILPVTGDSWHTIRTADPHPLLQGNNRIVIKALEQPLAMEWIRIGK